MNTQHVTESRVYNATTAPRAARSGATSFYTKQVTTRPARPVTSE